MSLSQSLRALLPLRRASHRAIELNTGAVICEVFSGAAGIEVADEIEALIVRAVNAHADMVEALARIVSEYRAGNVTIGAIEDAEAALAKASAA
jgi:hypothetical protein